MVCASPVKANSAFSRATGQGVCERQSCRLIFAEAGIV